jgi:hypothetical protein
MSESVLDFLDQFIDVSVIGSLESIEKQTKLLSSNKQLDLILQGSELFSPGKVTILSEYTFLADSRLSGIPIYCDATPCRYEYLHSLASFAVLYSDVTHVVNPFQYCQMYIKKDGKLSRHLLRNLNFAIFAILSLRPLLESGIIVFSNFNPPLLCNDCFTKALSSASHQENYHKTLFEHLHNTSKCIVEASSEGKCIHIQYDHSHGEHNIFKSYIDDRLNSYKEGTELTKKDLIDLGVFNKTINNLANDFTSKNLTADAMKIKNIFSNNTEVSFVSKFSNPTLHRSKIDLEYPMLTGLSFQNALNIRENEWHHLHDFRQAVNEITCSPNFTDSDYAKFARSETNKIEKILAKAQRISKNDLIDSLQLGAMTITATLLTHGLSTVVSAGAGVLGGGHAVQKAIPAIRKAMQIPEEARDSRFFFAWKIGKSLSNKH